MARVQAFLENIITSSSQLRVNLDFLKKLFAQLLS